MSNIRPLYLNGEFVTPTDTPPIKVTNPATGGTIGQVATVDREGVRSAIARAWQAFAGWRTISARERGEFLHQIADRLTARTDELARTITLENGKPLAQSRAEIAISSDHLHWFAEESRRAYGRIVPPQLPGKRHLVMRSPVGPVGAIAPWNFPLMLALRKIAPALAAGCPVILKPASATPLSAVRFAEIVDEVGLPAGVFQLVAGNAREIAAEMIENPACRKITFTGSTAVGRELLRAGAPVIKKLSLELGGHAAVLVFADADLDIAVRESITAKFRNTGQSCIAANRIYVQHAVYEEFLDKFTTATRALKLGDGLTDGVEIGPLIDEAGLRLALEHIEEAVAGGARVRCGGRRRPGSPGCFLEPTVLTDVAADARCLQEETFAPVAPVLRFADEAEAIRLANDTEYGLAAYAFTRDNARCWRLAEQLEAGSIGINDGVLSTSNCPFGGLKQSGLGRELGSEGLDAFLETKHVSFAHVDS